MTVPAGAADQAVPVPVVPALPVQPFAGVVMYDVDTANGSQVVQYPVDRG